MNEKVGERHLRKKAIVYVRQSTIMQLTQNEESRRLQYAMQDRLRSLGWTKVQVIDEDLGRSASGTVERAGFQRLVTEVSVGEVGAVAARELSRFARNSREWQQLVEVCRFVDTILVDQDAVYDPRNSNDRLLLGLKGSLNEYELELLRLRAAEARIAKAHRGEFITTPPIGYIKSEDGRLEKDPDLRVQRAVSRLFQKALELGGARPVMIWFHENGLQVPCGRGSRRRVVEWKAPHYTHVLRILRNPAYAGAYAYGRRSNVTSFQDGRPRVVTAMKPRAEWMVLLPDHHDGYVSWEEFERLQAMIDKNAQARLQTATGAAKKGAALLSGLLRCRRCGHKLMVRYVHRKDGGVTHRYACEQDNLLRGAERCTTFGGTDVDQRVASEILDVVKPAATEAAALAQQEEADMQDGLLAALETELKAARYAADRAFRQFDEADPENRLVAGELERRLEVALAKAKEIEQRLEKEKAARREVRAPASDPAALAHLASDLEDVWSDPASDIRLKKRIVRTLVEEIVADVEEEHRAIVLVIHWKGGVHTELRVPKRPSGRNGLAVAADIVGAVRELALVGPDKQIAQWLNMAGSRCPNGTKWTRDAVRALRSKRDIPCYSADRRRDEGWLILDEATRLVHAGAGTLKQGVASGALIGLHPLPNGPWIFKRSDLVAWRKRSAKHEPGDKIAEQRSLDFSNTYRGGAV